MYPNKVNTVVKNENVAYSLLLLVRHHKEKDELKQPLGAL